MLEGSGESRNDTNGPKIIDPMKFFNTVDQFEKNVTISLGWKHISTRYEYEIKSRINQRKFQVINDYLYCLHLGGKTFMLWQTWFAA